MGLSEGKRVGAGKPSTMPSSRLARANSILQPSPLLPLQANHRISIHSTLGPGPVHTFTLGEREEPSSSQSPDRPRPRLQLLAWLACHGLWPLTETEEGVSKGSAKVPKERADVVRVSSLCHQNTIPEHPLKSPAHLWHLLPHSAPPPTSSRLPCQPVGLYPRLPLDPPC